MLRCASTLVIAAYAEVRLIPQDLRALPAAFLRSRPIFATFKTFYEVVKTLTEGFLSRRLTISLPGHPRKKKNRPSTGMNLINLCRDILYQIPVF
jgi:hypothetical protein